MRFLPAMTVFLAISLQEYHVDGNCAQNNYPASTEITADGTVQFIQTLNYPEPYENDQRCQWHVTAADADSRIIIHVRDFSSEENDDPDCPNKDHAVIYDGADETAAEIFRVCYGSANLRKVYISSTNEIFVRFTADTAVTSNGISIAVFTNDTSNQPDCSTTLTATETQQYLLSDNLAYPYESDFQCTHTFDYDASATTNGIHFYMYFLDIEPSDSCSIAALNISVGDSNDTLNTVYSLCGSADDFTEASYRVKGNVAQLDFFTTSDVNITAEYFGYFLVYSTGFVGLNLEYPTNNETVDITVGETYSLGFVSTDNLIIANATGNLLITMLENGTDASMFGLSNSSGPLYFFDVVHYLDYETAAYYYLTFFISSSDAPDPDDTATVYFNIYVADEDDVAPVFVNLPFHFEILRNQKSGLYVYTVNTTDADASENFTSVVYDFEAEPNNYFSINETSGEIHLVVDADTIPSTTTNYEVTVIAFSVSFGNYHLSTTGLLNITIPPDSPPECNETTVYVDLLEAPTSAAGQTFAFLTPWNCTDDFVNITYSLGTGQLKGKIISVSPTLNSSLFAVDPDTAAVSLVRAFTIDEVPSRKFYLEILATDHINQTTYFLVQANVPNVPNVLVCLPNPRKLYARMDDAVGSVVLNDFNCTDNTDMTYTLTQFPENTFNVTSQPNGTASIVLNAPVFKIKFYSLSVFITNGIDEQTLDFEVVIQFERCGSRSSAHAVTSHWAFVTLSAVWITTVLVTLMTSHYSLVLLN